VKEAGHDMYNQLCISSVHDIVCFYTLQTKYGILLACCKTEDGRSVCIVRGLETLEMPPGSPIMNEYDCPLLSLTRTIMAVKPLEILRAVSIVHQCTESCRFIEKESARNVEREDIAT
jgi:hypothetical protein